MRHLQVTARFLLRKRQLLAAGLTVFMMAVSGCSGTKAEPSGENGEAMQQASLETPVPAGPEKIREEYETLIDLVKEAFEKEEAGPAEEERFSFALLNAGAYGTPGYQIEDINGDGTPELIFGVSRDEADDTVYDLYTISDGKLVHVLSGWERNRYYLCGNGRIANEGSSSAADSCYSYFRFDGVSLQFEEAVLLDAGEDLENPWFYSSKSESGEEREPISEETAKEIMGKYLYEDLELIPFFAERPDKKEENEV